MNEDLSFFRGYDLRGLVGSQLTEDTYYRLGKAYSVFLHERQIPSTIVGYDSRETSVAFSNAFIKGLTEFGIEVINIGLTLTPLMYFAQYHFKSKGGAMITASHNAKEFNGLKLAVGFSDTMTSDEIQKYKQIFIDIDSYSGGEAQYGKVENKDVWSEYKTYLDPYFQNDFGFKVVIDTAFGTAGKFAPELFRLFGCEVIEKNTQIDASFPLGTPDPTEVHFQSRLADEVIEHDADLGLSFDGDGDRMGVVDSEGNMIWNDILVAIFARDILEHSPGAKIIYNTLCSKVVSEEIVKYKGEPVMWLTGHSYIKSKVKQERGLFGGELSGHFFFMDNFFGHDDAFFAALRLLSYLKRSKKSLLELYSDLNRYLSSPEIKVGASDAEKFNIVSNDIASRLIAKFPQAKVNRLEGIRLDWEEGMVIARASQNGPYITVKFEASTDEVFNEIKITLNEIFHTNSAIDVTSGVSLEFLKS